MKVVFSARVEADIASQLEYGIDHFGQDVAERTFARVDRLSFSNSFPLTPTPEEYHRGSRGIYETWIAKTPFVIVYRVNTEAETITVLALFHHAQDRAAFDPED